VFSSEHEPSLLEFISGSADSSVTPKLLDIPRLAFPRLRIGNPYLFVTRYTNFGQAQWILRDVHYWSIFGVKRAHPEIIALFVGGFTIVAARRGNEPSS